MKFRKLPFLLVSLLILGSSCSTLQNLAMAPSNLETINAVKEVLNGSAFKAIEGLAKASNGGLEALLPEEARPVITTLKTLGLGDEINKLDKKLGVVSEAAYIESKGLMSDAIKEVKFEDAASIVMGGENAATIALKNAMYGAVKKRYSDRLDGQLANVDETKHWDTAVSAYNLFAKKKIEGSLSDFISERAVDAVFIAMGKEEAVIRKNPASLEKAVVTKVFDYYKDKK